MPSPSNRVVDIQEGEPVNPKLKTRRIAMSGDVVDGEFKFNRTNKWVDDDKAPGWEKKVIDNPGYNVSEKARDYVHKVKKSNFFRPSDKIIFKVPVDKLDDESSKLTTEPTKHWQKRNSTVNQSTGKVEPKGYYETSSEKSSHWTGGAPTPREQRRVNIKDKMKTFATLASGAIGWRAVNKLGQ